MVFLKKFKSMDNLKHRLTIFIVNFIWVLKQAAAQSGAAAGNYNLDDDRYIFSLRALLALRYAELYILTFIQGFVATWVIDLLKMYENIGAWFLLDKAEAFVRIKPFNGASSDCRHNESCNNK